MAERTIIPFGPQHPVLPEPIHLDLVIEDEKVVEAIPNIGFIHRGLELLCKKKTFEDNLPAYSLNKEPLYKREVDFSKLGNLINI